MIVIIAPLIILLATIRPLPSTAQPADLVTVTAPGIDFRKGETKQARIFVVVKEGYHVQASVVDDESLIPTSLVVEPSDTIIVVRTEFPSSRKFRLEGTDTFLKVYDGEFPIEIHLTNAIGSQPGEYNLAATLQYQACDSRTCFFPRKVEFLIPVRIVK